MEIDDSRNDTVESKLKLALSQIKEMSDGILQNSTSSILKIEEILKNNKDCITMDNIPEATEPSEDTCLIRNKLKKVP